MRADLAAHGAALRELLPFNGALTLTHHATSLILPGAANITTASGDTATLMSLGSGNWKCVDYQQALALPVLLAGTQTIAGLFDVDVGGQIYAQNLVLEDLIEIAGIIIIGRVTTASGITGAQTINKNAGAVNFAAGGALSTPPPAPAPIWPPAWTPTRLHGRTITAERSWR